MQGRRRQGQTKAAAVVFAALVVLSAAAQAQAPPDLPAFRALQEQGGSVEFMGHSYGLDGWRVTNPAGDHKYAYTTPEGGLLLGILLRPDGASETQAQVNALRAKRRGGQEAMPGAEKAKSAAARAEKLYAAAEAAAWIAAGRAEAPYIYVFVNTTCDHCHDYWRALQGPIDAGSVQVRLVPYGRKAENRDTGAALLSAADPRAAWNAFIAGDKGALDPGKATPESRARLDANTELVDAWKLKGPPFTLYRKPAGGEIMAVAGKPSNMLMLLSELMGGG